MALAVIPVGTPMENSKVLNDAPNDARTQSNIANDPNLKMDSPHVVRTKHWHRLEDGRVQCDLCPRFCKLHEGQRGFCFVRACADDQIVLTTYGRSSGFCVDPIEKKPLNHFLPGTPVLSFGTAGCNLGCKFCQNWDISKSHEFDTRADQASPQELALVAQQLGCRSVSYTYNDPVIFHEYAIDVAKACQERGIKSVAVSAGEVCQEPREEFSRYIHAANIDLKAFTDDFYRKVCAAHLQIGAVADCQYAWRIMLTDTEPRSMALGEPPNRFEPTVKKTNRCHLRMKVTERANWASSMSIARLTKK